MNDIRAFSKVGKAIPKMKNENCNVFYNPLVFHANCNFCKHIPLLTLEVFSDKTYLVFYNLYESFPYTKGILLY